MMFPLEVAVWKLWMSSMTQDSCLLSVFILSSLLLISAALSNQWNISVKLYTTGINGQWLLVFNPIGLCHCGAWCSRQGFPRFLWKRGCFGSAQEHAGQAWIGCHTVSLTERPICWRSCSRGDRGTQCFIPQAHHVLTAWHVLKLVCASHFFTPRCQTSAGFSKPGKADEYCK